MAQTIAINANGDMYLTGGNVTLLSGADAVGQDCVTAMRTVIGEMQYEIQNGMPYFQTAFNRYDPFAFEAAARGVIGAVVGVDSITAFTVQVIGNALTYTATIETIYGPTFING